MEKTKKTRKEKDSLGTVDVPQDAYYGAFTARAKKNFRISDSKAPAVFQKALGIVKLAAAETNIKLGLIDKKHKTALIKACKTFMNGNFSDEFTLDTFQAGAGTPYNMNANEIIANYANELLKGKKGEYRFINPNNDVNRAQSTNDVIPTATRIAILLQLPKLLRELTETEMEFSNKIKKYRNRLKVGRTHLQDAVPITFGQEFDSYKEALTKSRNFIQQQAEELKTLGIGGTAVGTGINTDPKYKSLIVKNLSKITQIKFNSAKNLTEIANNMNAFMNFSSALRSLSTNLLNISNDLKMMNMGPKAGLGEITLPEVQEGSSIMPGKVNPSILECLDMICLEVLGNDKTIELACQKSNFELNVMCPLIMKNLLTSMEILTNGIKMFRELCLKNLKINTEKARDVLEQSLSQATALTPYLGYHATAEIVKAALKKQIGLKEEILRRKIYNENELNKILSPLNTTRPSKQQTGLKKTPKI